MIDTADTAELESRLTAVLAVDAQRAPTGAQRLVRPVRVRPERHRLRWVAAAGAACVVAVAGLLVLAGQHSAPAFGSWQSRPGSITASARAGLAAACRQPAAAVPVILDPRGNSVYALYARAGSIEDCLTTIPGQHPDRGLPDSWLTTGLLSDVAVTRPDPAHPVVVLSAKSPEGNNPRHRPEVGWVSGRVAPGVARVRVQTSGGIVDASVRNGYFAAWWPGNDGDTAMLTGFDAAGSTVGSVDELSCTDIATQRFSPRYRTPGYPPTGGCQS